MKNISLCLLSALLFAACGGGSNVSKLGKEVCDCYKNANEKSPSDTTRKENQDDCMKTQSEAWEKVKDNKEKSDEFNKIIGACSSEMIKKSFGQ